MTEKIKNHQILVFINFALVYLFWGSTYLAIGVAVTENIPPAMLGAVRFTIAGVVMLAICAILGKKVIFSPYVFVRLGIIGVLLLTTGNVVLCWAEEIIPSGIAALLFATVPLWVAIIDSFLLRGDRLARGGLLGLFMGLVGLAILMWPKLMMPGEMEKGFWIASGILLVGALSWALGSICSRRWSLDVDPFSATAWQMLFSGLVNCALVFIFGDFERVEWTANGVGALVYLIVAGSWIGFTAYIWLLKHVATAKVATFAYVTPIVAVFLGWFFLRESVDAYVFVGAGVIVASVWLVNSSKVAIEKTKE